MLHDIRLSNLPPSAKLFVGIFTALMLCVCLWAMFIFYVEEGMVDKEQISTQSANYDYEEEADLRHNVGLAHTHVNGQTLLFFAIGLIFLFTSTPDKTKKLVLWIFGVSVFIHAIGLTGHHYHWFFDDILTISGVALLVVIAYMALMIYVDLGKQRVKIN